MQFTEFASAACKLLAEQGVWADFIDPCSGMPMVHRDSPSPYDEVGAFANVLGYKISSAGPCKILLHPKFGSSIYPASMFARCSREQLEEALTRAAEMTTP